MKFTRLEEAFWILGFAGHLLLLLILLVRRRWCHFPTFTWLIGYQLVISVILFLAFKYGTPHVYFVGYWLCAAGDFGLQLALVIEIAGSICRMNGAWVQTSKKGLWIWTGSGIAVAVGVCLTIAPPSIYGVDLWDLRASLFSSLLTCQLVLAVSTTANRLRLQRSSQVIALGQGLALWAAIAVVGDALKVATGWRHEFAIFDQIRMCVYVFDLGFWALAFWRPEKHPDLSPGKIDYTTLVQSAGASLAKTSFILGDTR